MVQLIIPMSGNGQRFKDAGFDKLKPLIDVDGIPMIKHVLNIFPGVTSVTFICNKEHLETTNMREILIDCYKNAKIVAIDPHKKGPVYAVAQAFNHINDNIPSIVSYCDYGTYWNFFNFLVDCTIKNVDGAIACYKGFHPHMLGTDNYAFVKTTTDNYALEVQEKKPFTENRMEEWASNGTYYFKTGNLLKHYFQASLDQGNTINGEYYVSMVYNEMIKNNCKVSVFPIQHMCQFGTPYDLDIYQNWSNYFKKIIVPKLPTPLKNCVTVLPMAGKGSRFAMKGYTTPKPCLDVNGFPMFHQAIDCLPKTEKHTFVCLKDHLEQYPEIKSTINQHYNQAEILELSNVTEGQACTCYEAIKNLDDNTPVLITACDNASYWNEQLHNSILSEDLDCVVWSFTKSATSKNNPNMYSWLSVDCNNNITQAYVKECPFNDPYEQNAIIGTFYFKSAKLFKDAYNAIISKNIRSNGEFYVDNMINECINLGASVKNFTVEHYICWGVPEEYETYNYWKSYFHKAFHHPYKIFDDVTYNKENTSLIDQHNQVLFVPQERDVVIRTNQGWGDLVEILPMVNFFTKIFRQTYFVLRSDAADMYSFFNIPNLTLVIAQKDINENHLAYNIALTKNAFMYTHQPQYYPLNLFPFINFSGKYSSYVNTKALWFSDDWYYDSCLDLSFKYCCMPKINFFSSNDTPFVLIHEDAPRGFIIDKSKIKNTTNIVNLNGRGNILFDNVALMFQAEEIHVINSVYALIAYYYSCAYGLNKPIYVHFYARDDRSNAPTPDGFSHAFYYPLLKNVHFVYK